MTGYVLKGYSSPNSRRGKTLMTDSDTYFQAQKIINIKKNGGGITF